MSMLAGGWLEVADLKKFCVPHTFLLIQGFILDIIEYAMIGTTSRQSWLFYLPLARQASLLKDDLLEPVDKLLDDPALVELVRQSLAGRRPRSTRTGRPSIAPDRLLRCGVVKHLKGWSLRELEREVRSNLVFRLISSLYYPCLASAPSAGEGEPPGTPWWLR